MSNCQNCFNGCTETVSDQCVRYTGINVPELGISTGDPLSVIEQSLTTFLVSALNGSGVKIDLSSIDVCTVVQQYLPTCGELSIADISKALIEAACNIQEQVDAIVATLAVLNADYTIGCLTGVTASSDTHAIVQATINALCALKTSYDGLVISLPITYVRLDQLDDLIQSYIDGSTGNLVSNKMVPYAVLPYFGPITFFNSTGAGTGDWINIYLCNGNNGTPDLRGRALTGVINGLSGPTLNGAVNPSTSTANPNYSLYDLAGANQIILDPTQIPPLTHTHGNTTSSVVTDPGHTHAPANGGDFAIWSNNEAEAGSGSSGNEVEKNNHPSTTTEQLTGITVATTVTINNTTLGEGLPHPNIQPVMACYYIQYRP
jgi:hypothetical protein